MEEGLDRSPLTFKNEMAVEKESVDRKGSSPAQLGSLESHTEHVTFAVNESMMRTGSDESRSTASSRWFNSRNIF